jgi:hypothetical protein
MLKAYRCKPIVAWATVLEFEWDAEDGRMIGLGADTLKMIIGFSKGSLMIHPYPTMYELSQNPFKSKRDMAAIIGLFWELPDDLRAHYPVSTDAPADDRIY